MKTLNIHVNYDSQLWPVFLLRKTEKYNSVDPT